MPHLSLTTWSLHRELGPLRWTYWNDQHQTHEIKIEEQPENISLLELPLELAKKNFQSLEVCHFHFPETDHEYLLQLKEAFEKSGVTFYCLLVDYGDISSNDPIRRISDIEYIKSWIDVAAVVGAKSVRVVGGEAQPNDKEALVLAKDSMKELVDYASTKKVRIVTENFKSLTSTKENCLELIQSYKGKIGLTVDFGNFHPDVKYNSIETLLPFAESVHAKANYNDHGEIDTVEYQKSLDLVKQSGYDGPITLVYDGPGDLWEGINRIKAVVQQYCN